MSDNTTFEEALEDAFEFIGGGDHHVIFKTDKIHVIKIHYCPECDGETTTLSKVFHFQGAPTINGSSKLY